MKKFLRRSGAALLAACTVWVVAATVESRSLPAAAEAMRESFQLPKALVQLELGDVLGGRDMSLSTLLALQQSPLLWAAYGTLPAQEEPTPEPQPETPEPQPQPEDNTPQPENSLTEGLTFADNGSPSQTVIPTASKSYTVAGSVFIKNSAGRSIDTALLDGTFPAKLGDSTQPQVLIIHTHGSEAYTMPAGEEYTPSGSYRTADTEKNMIRVGDEIAAVLSQYGISVLHDRQIHDSDYNSAYGKSRSSAAAYLEKYPSISFILDIHRDAVEDAQHRQYKLISQEDPNAAQISFVMGSNHDGWQENLKLAAAVAEAIKTDYPTVMRPITLRNSNYNQHKSPGSMLVEVGAAGNSLEEALNSARIFADGFAKVLLATKS